MRTIFWENLVKNVIIILLLVLAYPVAQDSFLNTSLAADKASVGNLLIAISILAVTACFGNYAFTYEKINHKSPMSRFLAHLTTGLLMFLIGLALEMMSILTTTTIGNLPIFNLSLIILYLASVLYDFWDLKRVEL